MKIDQISPETLSALKAAGWNESRSIDIDDWIESLSQDGHRLNGEAEAVLRRLGGLSASPRNRLGPNFTNDEPLTFDPIDAGFGHRVLGEKIESILGGSYFPVAEWLSNSSVFIGVDGHLVATGLGWLWELGRNVEEGLDLAILAHRPLICLHTFTAGADPWPPTK